MILKSFVITNLRPPIMRRPFIVAFTAMALSLSMVCGTADGAAPPLPRGPIATVGNRTVEALDIQRAAVILDRDPLRKQSPAQWRRMLLDRSVDRELLSMEAERRGYGSRRAVQNRIREREYLRVYQLVHEHVLKPSIEPTSAQLESLRAGGLYRSMDLHYILLRDDAQGGRRAEAERLVARLRGGAKFDSAAMILSGHPSRGNRGHFGPVLVRDLDPGAHEDIRRGKVGDVLGPYSGMYGHEIYKIGGFEELTPDSLRRLVRTERERNLVRDYSASLLEKYGFQLDSAMVQPLLFAVGSETPDSILASLRPDGTRPRQGVRPALGVIARVEGDSITFPDLIGESRMAVGSHGRIRIRGPEALRELAGQAFFRRLLVRDARERGLTKDGRIARDLRLIRDEAAVLAMVAEARPPDPDDAALRAWFDRHASRYRRPAARRARVVMFATEDSALSALRRWNGIGIPDSSLRALGVVEQPGAKAETIFPGRSAVVSVFEGTTDPLSAGLRSMEAGRVSPVIRTVRGYAVAHVLEAEPARPHTLEEVIDRVRRDWREEKENEWVLRQLERMRATTQVRVIPARLEAVKLGPAKGTGSRGSASR